MEPHSGEAWPDGAREAAWAQLLDVVKANGIKARGLGNLYWVSGSERGVGYLGLQVSRRAPHWGVRGLACFGPRRQAARVLG